MGGVKMALCGYFTLPQYAPYHHLNTEHNLTSLHTFCGVAVHWVVAVTLDRRKNKL